MEFKISPLDIEDFTHLLGQDYAGLAKLGVQRVVADSEPGYPCRVSLQDAKVGESVLLLNYEHQPMPTPFRSCHAIFVREDAKTANLGRNEIPEVLRHRFLSIRAFDSGGMIIDADVIDGKEIEFLIEKMFADDCVEYLHVHNAKLGCYLALVERA